MTGPRYRPPKDERWKTEAACKHVGPEVFFPVVDEVSSRVTRGEFARRRFVRMMCAGCSVRIECVVYAVQSPREQYGVWGGFTMDTMRGRRSAEAWLEALGVRPAPDADHAYCGTVYGYQLHRRADEPACDACKKANARKTTKYRSARSPAVVS